MAQKAMQPSKQTCTALFPLTVYVLKLTGVLCIKDWDSYRTGLYLQHMQNPPAYRTV